MGLKHGSMLTFSQTQNVTTKCNALTVCQIKNKSVKQSAT